jgi:hypothetical protein
MIINSRTKQIVALAAGAVLTVGGVAACGNGADDIDRASSKSNAQGAVASGTGSAAQGSDASTNDLEANVWIKTGARDADVEAAPRRMKVDNSDFVRTLKNLTWSNWGKPSATATGTMVADSRMDGEGELVTYPVTVTASAIKDGEASRYYTQLVVSSNTEGHAKEVFTLQGPVD